MNEGAEFGTGTVERVRTGLERIDVVLEAVERLDGRPVDEHVGVFETAHAELRHALDAPAQDAGADRSGDPA